MKGINQKKLARLLNVSRATVSRSLTNHPTIHPDTRARVQALAEKLGYKHAPTRVLRRTKHNQPLRVAVVVGVSAERLALTTFSELLEGVKARAAVDHVEVSWMAQDPFELSQETLRRRVFREIRASDWRGLILIYPFAPSVVQELSRKISTVSVLTEYDHLPVDTIDTDHSDIVGVIGRLAELGHRRVGFVTWHYPVGGRWAYRRFAAYAEGAFRHGLKFDPAWTVNVHEEQPRIESPTAIAEYVAAQTKSRGVTAWVCAADHQAYQLMGDLRRLGLDVPRDVSITGFDGVAPPPGLLPLTTLGVPHADIGHSAMSLVLSRILDPTAPRRKTLVETRLIEGATIAAAPKVG